MDKVFIKGLELFTLIGVYDFEREAKQRVIVDLTLTASLRLPGKTDNVEDTLDYGAIAQRLADIADTAQYQLLEALAEEMVVMILDEFAPVAVTLSINKPDILANASTVGITITRELAEHQLAAAQSNDSAFAPESN
ncbi:MAG: dihydroneopterin aldolase [Glaciecola sp.]